MKRKNRRLYRNLMITICAAGAILGTSLWFVQCHAKPNVETPQSDIINEATTSMIGTITDQSVFATISRNNMEELFNNDYTTSIDIDFNGVEEVVKCKFNQDGSGLVAELTVNSYPTAIIDLNEIGEDRKEISVVSFNCRYDYGIAFLESVYDVNGEMGSISAHVFLLNNGTLEKVAENYYSGRIGANGYMDEGIISNNVADDLYSYNAEEHMNGYIYNRSRFIADMKEIGIKMPFETMGTFGISYKRNVSRLIGITIE